MPGPRRKKPLIGRRRVEDEEGDEAGHDLEDSQSEGSISDDEDAGNASDGSNAASPVAPKATANGCSKDRTPAASNSKSTETSKSPPKINVTTDTDMMLNGLERSKDFDNIESTSYDELSNAQKPTLSQPVIVKSTAIMDQPVETPVERRRREHEDYKKKRDEDPAFVPNRGAFFMHDHRHSGPAANGFRPFGRGRGGRRGGRGGFGGSFAPANYMQQMDEPADAPWTHDMHEAVVKDNRPPRNPSQAYNNMSASRQSFPQAPRGPAPNRSLSTTKLIGNVQVRVLLPGMEKPLSLPAIALHQYTRLPDHRPPLRRDKPVRISLPDTPPRYIFPAVERSFIFIPRAMRPNQQGFGSRSNRGRQGLGSVGGFSRRTSAYGGSVYGSEYTPSVAMSRRSSVAHEIPRDGIISPMGSTMSRPPVPLDSTRPVVRLPPSIAQAQAPIATEMQPVQGAVLPAVSQPYPLPQKPTFRENRPNSVPMQHPRPQKAVSVDNIESPAAMQINPPQQYQQLFQHQVPTQANGHAYGQEAQVHPHSRNASYQGSTGTPLSQIPERAIHAQPFQPNIYQQQQGFYPPQYQVMPQQQGYYYPQQYNTGISAQAPNFAPSAAQQQAYGQVAPTDASQQGQQPNLVAQEVNGMVYYYDAAQIPAAAAAFPSYASPPAYPVQHMGNVSLQHRMMTPSPDAFYYPQPQQAVVYYPQ
ncbi:hypothetical protein VC83_06316 [Pseudogymnoascus destructans]|uniref:Btz domain-containing protein n=2 Tax=Pseudogymnoascus destructans TaxID=655981 RepID=L8FLS7_PSED2|nr:uncharacterized protein VC83_06316 [Pseudogymnoascus destructans]ELR01860.1 hypothetical protein GMDG_05047 [Pseudogymnoascus destructans 20631-21]OAF58918.1 hypothetical protein VC83_06316 [Pseudogymnoascus destructans]